MPIMPGLERWLCRSAIWGAMAGRVIRPWALGGVPPQGEVLEIGAGGGAMAESMLAAYPDIRSYTTIDPDPAMVAATQRRLARYAPAVTARRGDATDLPLDDGRFDLVLSFLMLHHVGDWPRALAEAVRVLRPGGVLTGYDLLDTAPARRFHKAEGAAFRLAGLGELRAALADLPVEPVLVTPRAFGLLVTFTARRQ
jgi:ubiquinone/menaquinone biosynthesis C-methylase UbiE